MTPYLYGYRISMEVPTEGSAYYVQAMYLMRAVNYAACVAIAIAGYEFIMNIAREVDLVWNRKWTLSSTILVVLKVTLAFQLSFPWIGGSLTICRAAISVTQVAWVVMGLAIASFGALRVHAISGANYHLSGPTLVLIATPMLLKAAMIVRSAYSYVGPPFSQCVQYLTLSEQVSQLLRRIGLGCFLAGNLAVLLVTWRMTVRQWLELRRLNQRATMTSLLLRDGTSEFVFVTTLQVMAALGSQDYALKVAVVQQCITPLYQVLSATVVCRFILNLRQLSSSDGTAQWRAEGSSYGGALVFRAMRGRTVEGNEPADGLSYARVVGVGTE